VSRTWFGCLLIVFHLLAATAVAEPTIRIGSLRYGTLSWQLDVIAKNGLDKQEGIRVEPLELAATPAAQLALQAGSVDLIVSDWLWVSRQRAEGGDLTSIPFSSAIGALIVPAASPIRDVAGLAGRSGSILTRYPGCGPSSAASRITPSRGSPATAGVAQA
jgi:NitT/TauT family transport system substrate-binding protein